MPLISLSLACLAFVGSHLAMSHPLRAPMVGRLGERGFQAVYSLISLATLAWVYFAFRAAPAMPPLWDGGGDLIWIAATALMWCASVLLAGSLVGNPALPDPNAAINATHMAKGVFGITRHPMMLAFTIWGAVHIMVMPALPDIILAGSIIFLAFAGALGQDRKKMRQLGTAWQGWQGRTAFVPFGMQMDGKAPWRDAMPSPSVLIAGTLI